MFHLLTKTPRRSHELRYVLRNKQTEGTYLVVVFTIYLREDVNEDGTLKEGAEDRVAEHAISHEGHDEKQALKEVEKKLAPDSGDREETSPDDVD